jgi:hypothetical protein
MESGRLFFDPTACRGSNMLFLGNGDNIFRDIFLCSLIIKTQVFFIFYFYFRLVVEKINKIIIKKKEEFSWYFDLYFS